MADRMKYYSNWDRGNAWQRTRDEMAVLIRIARWYFRVYPKYADRIGHMEIGSDEWWEYTQQEPKGLSNHYSTFSSGRHIEPVIHYLTETIYRIMHDRQLEYFDAAGDTHRMARAHFSHDAHQRDYKQHKRIIENVRKLVSQH